LLQLFNVCANGTWQLTAAAPFRTVWYRNYRNCNVIIALLFGYLVAGLSDYEGASYVDKSKITEADAFTFLWTETFPLGLYGPAVIPLLIAYLVTTVETVGDISAVYEVSDLDTTSLEFRESLQGGLTSDSICSLLFASLQACPTLPFLRIMVSLRSPSALLAEQDMPAVRG
jgi:xanthine/uracil permease